MPSYRGHALGGIVAFGIGTAFCMGICAVPYSKLQAIEWLLCALVGSLFPDIDTKSKGQKLIYSLLLLLIIVFIIQRRMTYAAYLAVIALIPHVTHHRGMCHQWWFSCMVGTGAFMCAVQATPHAFLRYVIDLFFFFLGVGSHLILDRRWARLWR
jgi:hypothetical protein